VRKIPARIDDDIIFQVGNALLDFAVGNVDLLADHDAAQLLERDLLAHSTTKICVVDTVGCKGGRHLVERNTRLLGHECDRLIQHLVRYREADLVGSLQLNLGKDEAFEYLFLQDTGRRQLESLLLRALRDQLDFVAQLALQHYALVDDCRHAVEKLAGLGEFLGGREWRHRDRDNRV
jgi:hypothetical protein